MLSLYVDNFRGFTDTVIDLRDVNFLVGENSTGKTSILCLFSLFQDQTFWFTHDFNTEAVSLGNYDEISLSSTSHFRIGYGDTNYRSPFEARNEGDCRYYLLEFCNRDNIPSLSSIRVRSPEIDIFAKWDGTDFRYLVKETQAPIPSFCDWIHESLPSTSSLVLSKVAERVRQRPMLHAFLQIIEEETRTVRPRMSLWTAFYPHVIDRRLAWIAPVRAKPKRTYDSYKVTFSPEGDHAPYVLKELLSSRRTTANEADARLRSFGKSSGLFKKIDIHKHGKGKTAPFEIYVQLGTRRFKIANVGYGVAQVLPIIIELLARPEGTWFCIQQPEVHLHPKAQAELGSTIYVFANQNADRFLVETHSDFLIDRFRREMSTRMDTKASAQLLFFERQNQANKVYPIEILPSGSYSQNVPEGFRDFFIKEQLSLLGL